MRQLVVIGAGAAGLMAAIIASRKKRDVLLLERNHQAGLKILATGDGKGNLSNLNLTIDHYHGKEPSFVRSGLDDFGFQQTRDFFEELGIKLIIDDQGRIFPASREASIVQKKFISEIQHLKVEMCLGVRVQEIQRIGQFFEIKMKQSPPVFTKRIILATGGLTAPQLGATGDGYHWAARLGHHIVPQFPALIQLNAVFKDSYLLDKVKLAGIRLDLFIDEQRITSKIGDLLFIHHGISGSTVFAISRLASEALFHQRRVVLQVNFIPNIPVFEIKKLFEEKKKKRSGQSLVLLLEGVLPEKISHFILKALEIEENQPVGLFQENQIDQLIQKITHFYIPVTGVRSWKYAQVTCGGIDVTEVNPRTMESKIIPHLYFAGEILDIDGDCGGYNLQWAWSSGYLAGKSAGEG